ncbi:MAG: UPF0147 family protein [Candidatus Altiarchaeales archaeon]|nr:UPF0147 family protein [Candidatus Altiarchaeales archaeon]
MDLSQVIEKMSEASQDNSMPARVRRTLDEVAAELRGDDPDTAVKVTTAIYNLDDIVEDVNISMHAKTVLWDIISDLESIRGQ